MNNKLPPLNLKLYVVTDELAKIIKPVSVFDVFDNTKVNFHKDGLFSTEIFGTQGSPSRLKTLSYIDIKVPILHPLVYKKLALMKQLYADIMASKAYAKWDDREKNFIRSNPLEGSTGYNFFVKHLHELIIPTTNSKLRDSNIELVYKSIKENLCFNKRIIVYPAGLRDVIIKDGRVEYDDVNMLYKKLIALANNISPNILASNKIELLDKTRYSLQLTFNEIFKYFEKMFSGKNKFIMKKWLSRAVAHSSRNVISSIPAPYRDYNDPRNQRLNEIITGIFQTATNFLPFTLYNLRSDFLATVFSDNAIPACLVNKKTLKTEKKKVSSTTFDYWGTDEGLIKLIGEYSNPDFRNEYIEVEGCYLGLIWKAEKNHKKYYCLLNDKDALNNIESNFKIKDYTNISITPITYAELLYNALYKFIDTKATLATRFPVDSMFSTTINKTKLKTTVQAEIRQELIINGILITTYPKVATEFPISGGKFIETISPHPSKLKQQGADFDGDTESAIPVYSDEANAEIFSALNKSSSFLNTQGKLTSSMDLPHLSKTLTMLVRGG